MAGSAALQMRYMLVTFSSSERAQSASVQSRIEPAATQPAQLKTTSKAGRSANKAAIAAASVTSRARVSTPFSEPSLAGSTSVASTRAPSRANASAVARPIPWPAAVTRQALPLRRSVIRPGYPLERQRAKALARDGRCICHLRRPWLRFDSAHGARRLHLPLVEGQAGRRRDLLRPRAGRRPLLDRAARRAGGPELRRGDHRGDQRREDHDRCLLRQRQRLAAD